MKILVTGGAGFVGTNLIKRLLTQNHSIISIDNYNTGLHSNHQDGAVYINEDISNLHKQSKYFWEKFDVVFHLAAIARIQPSFDNPKEYFETNASATFDLAKLCAEAKIPLIYAGSSSHHSGKFKNPYTFSKDIGEEVIKLCEQHFGLKASITRFYNVYGPHQLLEGGYTTLIGRWINNIKNNIQCEIYGDGEKRRDFTHVDDIVDALIMIMEQQAYGYNFELGRGKNYSVNEIAKAFNINPIHKNNKPGEAQDTLNTDTTANDVLGWNPTKDVLDYIQNLDL